MRAVSKRSALHVRMALPAGLIVGLLCGNSAARGGNVIVPGATDFPESMTASTDGTLYFSSIVGGRIFRALPGEAQASEWIRQGTNGLCVCAWGAGR